MLINEAISTAVNQLKQAGIDSSETDAKALMLHILGINLSRLLLQANDELSKKDEDLYFKKVHERVLCKPFAYITGEKEFYSLPFTVNEHTLIPRPETELLVENAIEFLRTKQNAVFLDFCTGSGNIPIAICHELRNKSIHGYAFDISLKAIHVAQENKKTLKVKNLSLFCMNLHDGVHLKQKFDLITANPPYIPIEEKRNLQKDITDYEPHGALFSEGNGCKEIFKIIISSITLLKQNGLLLMEISDNKQAEEINSLFYQNELGKYFSQPEFINDYAGIKRILKLISNCTPEGVTL
ncbi:MAG: peptide chain release factor N(5)-glutamine methyltransferase [Nitrospinae bacterium]|nr:peptide chain release factor N(5)-glutamine methyltransferase [Nitrospinota bacterium]